MTAPGTRPATREVRIQGARLLAATATLILIIVVAFLAGRLYEQDVRAWAHGSAPRAEVEHPKEPPTGLGGIGPSSSGADSGDATSHQVPAARDPARDSTNAPTPERIVSAFFVQVFAARHSAAATNVRDHLVAEGYAPRVSPSRVRGNQWFRVRLDAPTAREAQALVMRLQSLGYSDAWMGRSERNVE